MACFTAEYPLHTSNALAVDSCQVGQDIWVIRRFAGYNFSMHKWNIDTQQWSTVEYKNIHLIERDNGLAEDFKDFVLTSANDKLYMWRELLGGSEFLIFDPMTFEWTRVVGIVFKPIVPNFVIVNNDVFINSKSQILVTFNFESLDRFEFEFSNFVSGIPRNLSFYSFNDVLYYFDITADGSRIIVKYDKENEQFVNIYQEFDAPRNYLKMTGTGQQYQTSCYGYKNKIYQRIQFEERLMLDCYDMETNNYCTIFDTDKIAGNVIKISGTDRYAYLVIRNDGGLTVKIIDLMPTLETLSFVRLVDHTVGKSSDYIRGVKAKLPCGLRQQFENMATLKTAEMDLLKRDKTSMFFSKLRRRN